MAATKLAGNTTPLIEDDGSGGHKPYVIAVSASGGSVAVDTELPAAAALADNTANPTTPLVGSCLLGYDGATWDRLRVSATGLNVDTELPDAAALADNMANPTAPAVGAFLMGWDTANWDRLQTSGGALLVVQNFSTAAGADTLANSTSRTTLRQVTEGYLFNGATWDRPYNNNAGTLLASAARTATTQSADQTLFNNRGVRVTINVTAIVSSPSVTFAIEVKDPISGAYTAVLTSAAITGTGTTTLVVYPGITAAANVAAAMVLARTWRVSATHGNANSITYSVAYDALQ